MHDVDVVLTSLKCPEPQEHQWQPADVLRQNSATAPDYRESLSVKYPDRIPNRRLRFLGSTQRLDNIGWPLPLVAFSLDGVQARKGIETLVGSVEKKQDAMAQRKKKTSLRR